MIRQFAAGLLELAAEALRPTVPTKAQEEERARLVWLARGFEQDRDREKDKADEAEGALNNANDCAAGLSLQVNAALARIAELERVVDESPAPAELERLKSRIQEWQCAAGIIGCFDDATNATPEVLDGIVSGYVARIAELEQQAAQVSIVGHSEGKRCNRNPCPGVIETVHDGDGCSCHINPPCHYCTSGHVECPECGWSENEKDQADG